jgi:hypothetical protein
MVLVNGMGLVTITKPILSESEKSVQLFHEPLHGKIQNKPNDSRVIARFALCLLETKPLLLISGSKKIASNLWILKSHGTVSACLFISNASSRKKS